MKRKDIEDLINEISLLEAEVVEQCNQSPCAMNLRLIGQQEAYEKMLKRLQNRLREEWILCSDRLPQENERWISADIIDAEPRCFIVMVKGATEPTTGYYHTSEGWIKDLEPEYNRDNTGFADEIIAWRFFPTGPDMKGGNPV